MTGGVGSGKSTVFRLLLEKGAFGLDADAIVRTLLERADIRRRIARHFGPQAFRDDGSIDKPALAHLIFSQPSARRALEGIIHPEVRKIIRRELRARSGTVAVCDIPLLFESGWAPFFDRVAVVTASRAARTRRLKRKGWRPSDIERRMKAQWPLARKAKKADFVINNDGTVGQTRKQVRELWRSISTP